MQAQFEALGKTMQTSLRSTAFPDNLKTYQDQIAKAEQLRTQFTTMAQASGAYSVETVKAVSATQSLSKSIADQKLTLSGALQNLKNFQAGWREQAALQKASLVQFTSSATGKNSADLLMPRELTSDLDSFRAKYGYINQAIGSIATQTINWGKNTQWAGRQITVGIGMPIAMVMAAMAKSALTADQDLTKITKVYNTTVDQNMTLDQQQASTTAQLSQVRKAAMQDAITMAKQYGASMDETLQTEADLAAVGKTGNDLRETTSQVTKVATLGELDHQTALQMTISLQNAYQLSSKQLGDAFNYINDIENTTSLTTQDFAAAIPKAAAAMASMGVSVQQTGVLLVALKQGGVDAEQGMNALKSATTRLLKPTADAQSRFMAMGIDIQNVSQAAGGNLLTILEKLGPAMEGQQETTKQAALAALFGTYQYNKLNVALTNVSEAYQKLQAGQSDPNDQTLQALNVMGQDPSQWAAVANQEQKQLQQSISFQWKSTIEQIKTEMATLGQSVLQVLVPIAQGVLGVVKWFNSWGDTSKKIALSIAGLVMLSGPFIMLIGLFGNLFGNAMKFASAISNLVIRFKVLDPAQRAQELLAKQAANAFDAEAGSIARLNLEMQNLVKTQLAAAASNGVKVSGLTGAAAGYANQVGAAADPYANHNGLSPSGAPLPFVVQAKNGRTMNFKKNDAGRKVPISAAEAESMRKAALEADAIAESGKKASVSFGTIATKLAMFGGAAYMLKGMVDDSGGLASNMANAAMFVMLMAGSGGFGAIAKSVKAIPTLLKGAVDAVSMGIWTIGGKLSSAIGKSGGIGKAISGLGSSLLGFLTGPAGIVAAVAAVGVGWYTIAKQADNAYKNQEKINDSTKDWASVLGYAEKSFQNINTQLADPTGMSPSAWKARQEQVDKLQKSNSALVDTLKGAYKDGHLNDVYGLAENEAFKVKLSGGSGAQAKQAFQIALQAAGVNDQQFQDLNVRFQTVDVENTQDIAKHINDSIDSALKTGASGGLKASAFRLASTVTGSMQDAGTKLGEALKQGLQASTTIDQFQGFAQKVNDSMANTFDNSDEWKKFASDNKSKLADLGIKNVQGYYEAVQKAMADQKNNKMQGNDKSILDLYFGDGNGSDAIKMYQETYHYVFKQMKDDGELTQGQLDDLEKSGYSADAITRILGRDLGGLGTGASAAASAMNNLSSTTDEYSYNATQVTSAMQSVMKGTMSDVYNQANSLMQISYQAQVNGIQQAGQARQDALDAQGKAQDKAQKSEQDALKKSQDGRTKYYDDQIKQAQDAADAQVNAIQAQIDAETKSDDIRQKLFDREKTRIERLAEIQNDNIDYNTALNKGSMDEAAKAYNTHQSKVQGWAIDDQNTAMSEQLKALQDAQQAQIKNIQAVRDTQVKALQDQKDALQAVFDIETQQMQDRQQAQKDLLDAKKKADQEATASAATAAQDQQRINQVKLDQELMALKASTPRTQAEMNDQITKIEGIYQKYGVDLQGYGVQWSGFIGDDLRSQIAAAAAGLQNDVDWATLGNNITALLGDGAGLNSDQLKQFLATGQWPASAAPKAVLSDPHYYVGQDGKMKYTPNAAHHIGGMAGAGGLSQASRVGYPVNADPYQSEILTLLQRGEYVVNKGAAAQHRPLLEAINSGAYQPGAMLARHVGGSVPAMLGDSGANLADSFGAVTYLALGHRMADLMNKRMAAVMATGSGGGVGGAYTGGLSGGVEQWRSTVEQVLSVLGQPLDAVNGILHLIQMESAGNPNAINLWDSNAAAGHPSQGLMQTIPSTFLAYAGPYASRGITDPFANIYAGVSYALRNYGYGMLASGGRKDANGNYLGYDNGGYLPPVGVNYTGKPEPVFTSEQWGTLSRLVSSSTNVLGTVVNGNSLANGIGSGYNIDNVTIDLRGATVKDEVDFKKCVKEALYEIDNQNGLNRKVGDGWK